MIKTIAIQGMTCAGCRKTVEQGIDTIEGISKVRVNLASGVVTFDAKREIPLEAIQGVLAEKYKVLDKSYASSVNDLDSVNNTMTQETSKLKQLRPLFLIFTYISVAALVLHRTDMQLKGVMLDFMGLFYIVFSFFKFLDVKGFTSSFSMYDPLAKSIPMYGWIYPFVELGLGVLLLFRFKVYISLILTIVILGITTIGVTRVLLNKTKIQCACLGTALKLPMTEATFIENAIMLLMAVFMLFAQL